MVNPDAVRGQVLLEESREAVVVLDEDGIVLAASRRARQSLGRARGRGARAAELLAERARARRAVRGRRPRRSGSSISPRRATWPRTRSCAPGFTAAVSHELRTPLARLLSLLELAALPGEDVAELIEQARARGRADPRADRRGAVPRRARVGDARRLARRRARAAGAAGGRRRARGAGRARRRHAARRGRRGRDRRGAAADAPRRRAEPGRERDPLRGPGANATLSVAREDGAVVVSGRRRRRRRRPRPTCRACSSASTAPTARAASRGTGLGLAIVKHVVASAGGTRRGERRPRRRGSRFAASFPSAA